MRLDPLASDDPALGPVGSLDEDMRREPADQVRRRVLGERDDRIDGGEPAEDRHALLERIDGASGPLEAAHGGVAVDADDEDVPSTAGRSEEGEVTGVEEVEAPVREDDALPV